MKFPFVMPDKVYNWLKWIALIALGAIGWGYSEIAEIWGLPYGTEVCMTLSKIATVLGALIGVSTIGYYKEQNNGGTD